MRIKSHWFKPGAEKSATEIAGAAGFIVFRIAQNALKRMRGAGYELPPGAEGLSAVDARQVGQALIDTLGMLQQKTAGRLDPDEQKLLDEVLTALRFRFVQGGSAP